METAHSANLLKGVAGTNFCPGHLTKPGPF